MQRLSEIDANRVDRQSRRRQQRKLQTENFFKSLHMLQANNYLRETDENGAFEDYSIFMYRQSAPEFNDRVKELERKLLYPVRIVFEFDLHRCLVVFVILLLFWLFKLIGFFFYNRTNEFSEITMDDWQIHSEL